MSNICIQNYFITNPIVIAQPRLASIVRMTIISIICVLEFSLVFASDSNPDVAKSMRLLQDKEWVLANITRHNDSQLEVKKGSISILFKADGKVSGQSAVNRYFGQYEIDNKNEIKWKGPGFGMTMMAGPPEQMEQEKIYMQSLERISQFVVKKTSLILQDTKGKLRMEFVYKAP